MAKRRGPYLDDDLDTASLSDIDNPFDTAPKFRPSYFKLFGVIFFAVWLGILAADFTEFVIVTNSIKAAFERASLTSSSEQRLSATDATSTTLRQLNTTLEQKRSETEAELNRLRAERDVMRQEQQKQRKADLAALSRMQQTCDFWKKRYPETEDSEHRMHMENACRDVDAFRKSKGI